MSSPAEVKKEKPTCLNADQEDDEPSQDDLPVPTNACESSHSEEGAASSSRKGAGDQQESSCVEIRKLYIGNINRRTSTQELKDTFGSFGRMKNAHFARKRDGSRDSFAFVTYYEPSDAARVLATGVNCGIRLRGSVVTVSKASIKHQPRQLASGKMVWQTAPKPTNRASSPSTESVAANRAKSTTAATAGVQVEQEIDESKCFVQGLNDDCLMHIFSYLPRKELVKSERVCKRWQHLCIQMWLYIKELDFSWLSEIDGMYQYGGTRPLNRAILNQFLSRCGPNLTSLDLSYRFTKVNVGALEVIANECQNLKCLNLSYCPIGKKGFKSLCGIAGTLERVLLESCGNNTKDVTMMPFLEKCVNLKSLVLASNVNLTGQCLRGVNGDKLEDLILDNCNGLKATFVKESFARFKSLKRLSVNGCVSIDPFMLDDMLKSIPQLTNVSMSLMYPKLYNSNLIKLAHLTELVSLTLYQNPAVNDQVLRVVSKSCRKLVHLDISGCSVHSLETTLTDDGMLCVAQLPSLAHLKMSYMAVLTDQSLESLAEPARLKTLECRGCPTFTDFGCSRVIELCNDLELFDISGCSFVSGRTVENALSAVKLRTNNVKLRLIAGGTSIWACSQTDPLLDVDLIDLCVDRHRPDFVDDIYFLSDSEDGLDEDDIDNFDWECQSMFLNDDLGEWFLANIENGFYNSDDDEDDEDFYPF